MSRSEAYDVQVTVTLNPLNWACSFTRFYDWGVQVEFGPLSVLVLRPVRRVR